MTPNPKNVLLALALIAAPVTAAAQTDTTTTTTDVTTTDTGTTDTATGTDTTGTDTAGTTQNDAITTTSESDGVAGNERQGGFPWGLLGLLGLAGLAGRSAAQPRTEVKLGGPTEGPRRS